MPDDSARFFSKIRRLVADSSDDKVLRGGGERARELLEEVVKLTAERPAPPWDALAAYRLAHLRMRSASTDTDLLVAEELFLQAARQPGLGAWPRLFHLAVLHRLRQTAKLSAAFAKARDAVCESLGRDRPSAALSEGEAVVLQDGRLNALELCCYFLDEKYESIEGVGVLPVGRRSRNRASLRRGWYLVSHGLPDFEAASSIVVYVRDLARAELDALAADVSPAFLFELPRHGHGRLWVPGGPEEDAPAGGLRLVAGALARDEALLRDEDEEILSDSRLRQQKKRFRKRLQSLGVDLQETALFPAGRPVIGLVEER